MIPPASHRPTPALSRHAVMAQAFEIMADNLGPFIDERMGAYFADEPSWSEAAANRLGRPGEHGATDPLFQLLVLRRFWGPVFADFYGHDIRRLINELIDLRNQWAHFRLPDDVKVLGRAMLSVERILSPVSPESASGLRRLRADLDASAKPGADKMADKVADKAADPTDAGSDSNGDNDATQDSDEPAADDVDVLALEQQLAETESVFQELQDRYGSLESELSSSRRIAAHKQLRLSTLEKQLAEIEGRSLAAEAFLAEERHTRNRIEWLFVGLLATLLLFMVLASVT